MAASAEPLVISAVPIAAPTTKLFWNAFLKAPSAGANDASGGGGGGGGGGGDTLTDVELPPLPPPQAEIAKAATPAKSFKRDRAVKFILKPQYSATRLDSAVIFNC